MWSADKFRWCNTIIHKCDLKYSYVNCVFFCRSPFAFEMTECLKSLCATWACDQLFGDQLISVNLMWCFTLPSLSVKLVSMDANAVCVPVGCWCWVVSLWMGGCSSFWRENSPLQRGDCRALSVRGLALSGVKSSRPWRGVMKAPFNTTWDIPVRVDMLMRQVTAEAGWKFPLSCFCGYGVLKLV